MYRILAIGVILLAIAGVMEATEKGTTEGMVEEVKGLKDFSSLTELKLFLLQDPTDLGYYKSNSNDCDDFAVQLSRRAEDKGFKISLQFVSPELYSKYFDHEVSGNHMICSAIVRNKVYFIEPQTDEVEFVSYLD